MTVETIVPLLTAAAAGLLLTGHYTRQRQQKRESANALKRRQDISPPLTRTAIAK